MQGTGPAPVDPLGPILGPESAARATPRHHFFAEEEQYRLKLQRFSKAPPEVTIQKIDFGRDVQAYTRAYHAGQSHVPSGGGGRRGSASSGPESVIRSQRRAKIAVRLRVTELAPNALFTFTTRKIYTLDELIAVWGRFCVLARMLVPDFEYVCVPEPHPRNPIHLHLHAAVRGRFTRSTLRRLWHMALEAHEGRRVTCILRGPEAPGNVDIREIRGREVVRRIRKIAKYISKYITKDLIERFNRRRYWPSKGINLQSAQVFWLDALTQNDAIREACILVGAWEDGLAPKYRIFAPSDRVAWFAFDPPPTDP